MGQVVLVRHGQASFGAADYDVLSAVGREQAAVLGRALAHLRPDVVVHGSLVRQRDTARIAVEAAGWTAGSREDARWDELDQLAQFATLGGAVPDESDATSFQRWYEAAMSRWSEGHHDGDYSESYAAFQRRALSALEDVAADGTAVVFSSGGPIVALVTRLLDAGPATYARLLPTTVNTGLTRVVAGRRGLTLLSFNEHGHLAGDLVTYR